MALILNREWYISVVLAFRMSYVVMAATDINCTLFVCSEPVHM